MPLKKLIKKVRKTSVGKLAGKMVAVNAGIVTAGLVKPKVLGIKSQSNQRIFKTTGKVTRGVAIATGATFAAVGAPVALGGAGVGSGGLFAGAGGPLAGVFGKAATQGNGATSTGLAERMKSITEGGELGASPELVRNIQENDAELRGFEMPSMAASLGEMIQANLPLVLGGLALITSVVFLWRRK
jgi:hypothetical protein